MPCPEIFFSFPQNSWAGGGVGGVVQANLKGILTDSSRKVLPDLATLHVRPSMCNPPHPPHKAGKGLG